MVPGLLRAAATRMPHLPADGTSTGNPGPTGIREAIDALDGRIVELIGERQGWVEQAGRLKRTHAADAVTGRRRPAAWPGAP
jgi:hypothetical protein